MHGTPFPREKLPFKSRSPSATPAGNISCQRFIPWLCHSPAASLSSSSRHRPKGTFVQQCLQTISCREARGNLEAQTTCVAGCKPHRDTSDTRTHTGLTPANPSLKGDFAQSQQGAACTWVMPIFVRSGEGEMWDLRHAIPSQMDGTGAKRRTKG